jgi:hypothetical protein
MKTRLIQQLAKTVLFLLFFYTANGLLAQRILKGTIIDESRNEPIPFASVFLTNTTFGVSADEEGKFSIKIPEGNYDVIVRMLGYESLTFSLNSAEIQSQGYRILLLPNEDQLEEIEIEEERDPVWYRNLAVFKTYFLGSSENAKSTILLNENVLRLDDQSEPAVLKVKASDILKIKNPNLGYSLDYLLTDFRYEVRAGYIFYGGNPLFIPDTTLSLAKQKKVASNREEAYRGSLQHFIRALYQGKVTEEGFEIRRIDRIPKDGGHLDQLSNQLLDEESLLVRDSSGKVFLQYDFHLHILYKLEKESTEYARLMKGKKAINQTSIMKVEVPKLELYENGGYANPFGIMIENYMAWERVADLLPLNYISPEVINK